MKNGIFYRKDLFKKKWLIFSLLRKEWYVFTILGFVLISFFSLLLFVFLVFPDLCFLNCLQMFFVINFDFALIYSHCLTLIWCLFEWYYRVQLELQILALVVVQSHNYWANVLWSKTQKQIKNEHQILCSYNNDHISEYYQ